MRIYKQEVPFEGVSTIPKCLCVVKVAMQYGRPTAWYIHEDFVQNKTVEWVWTGQETKGLYIDTLFYDELVWHLIQK